MIDLHCHLLPGVDDGAQDLSESLELARIAVSEGISTAVLTPHFHPGRFDNDIDGLSAIFNTFKAELSNADIALDIHLAAEVRMTDRLLSDIPNNRIPFLGVYQGWRVLLLELPYSHIPPGTEQLINWLNSRKIMPMIAHPERNREVIQNPNILSRLSRFKLMYQLTIGSFSGDFGDHVQATATSLLQMGFVGVLATDAHSVKRRPPIVAKGLAVVSDMVGEAQANQYIIERPAQILQGRKELLNVVG
ncbi:capsular biosynthesis protein [Corallincola luteus]|uniref:protein-tyrosine-phosphatase n=1 Tax=Corallincola luteus TaxID=1775177 RepID=A0ABY2AM02_9GAMM|nr:CpsB/CapC family capsule biosynthesis tyrosine phosphatase [Corallincola luteus]TCI02602.1 capsular biosynthesis protein [Corallincola luteus]